MAISKIVGKKSVLVTGVSFTLPGWVTPGQRTIIGSKIITEARLAAGDFDAIRDDVVRVLGLIKEARGA